MRSTGADRLTSDYSIRSTRFQSLLQPLRQTAPPARVNTQAAPMEHVVATQPEDGASEGFAQRRQGDHGVGAVTGKAANLDPTLAHELGEWCKLPVDPRSALCFL